MTSAAHALQVPLPVFPSPTRWREVQAPASTARARPTTTAWPAAPSRRLRLVAASVARPCDRSDRAALLRELDLRRRRAQIAARHAVGIR